MHVDDFVGILGGYQAFREEHGTNITVKNMFGETVLKNRNVNHVLKDVPCRISCPGHLYVGAPSFISIASSTITSG